MLVELVHVHGAAEHHDPGELVERGPRLRRIGGIEDEHVRARGLDRAHGDAEGLHRVVLHQEHRPHDR